MTDREKHLLVLLKWSEELLGPIEKDFEEEKNGCTRNRASDLLFEIRQELKGGAPRGHSGVFSV